jgi:hypothetical protein
LVGLLIFGHHAHPRGVRLLQEGAILVLALPLLLLSRALLLLPLRVGVSEAHAPLLLDVLIEALRERACRAAEV